MSSPPQSLPPPTSPVVRTIAGRARDLGDGFAVRRVLPVSGQRALGPFVFLDEMGPVTLPPGAGMDVRPHPHIHLATVTYLYSGRIEHRDSLGVVQLIEPGAVNFMTAGAGIAHSERTAAADRLTGMALHGLQLWVALPSAVEDQAPSFHHHPADTLPTFSQPGVAGRLLLGEAFGLRSPVAVHSPLVYLDARVAAGSPFTFTPAAGHQVGVYVVSGGLRTAPGEPVRPGELAVFAPDAGPVAVVAEAETQLVLLGGAPLDGVRHLWWNFVSSRPEAIEAAKARWAAGEFPRVPGDDEFIPLPQG